MTSLIRFVLTMNRWFRIDAAVKDLHYAPIVGFGEGWPETIQWFREHWLPTFQNSTSVLGLNAKTQRKIDIQKGTGAGTARGSA